MSINPSGDGAVGAFVAELAAGEAALAIAAARGGPPAEVLEQMAAARAVGERLREDGLELRFNSSGAGGPTSIELQDLEGNALRGVTIAEALDLAAGRPLR